jgi:ABC-type transport auxiliary lipoprotein component
MTARRSLLAAGAAAALAAALPSSAPAAEPAASAPYQVDVTIQRFAVQGQRVVARGVARAGLRDASGAQQIVTKPVTFQVRGGGATCRVLTLHLDTLQLTLLGLRVDTSAVNLLITGRQRGGALGQLFCRLARGIRLGRTGLSREAAKSLNSRIGRKPLRAIGFRTKVFQSSTPAPTARQSQAAPPPGSCQVLDLILGPLNLDLLGLRVDLYGATAQQPVRVLITANPAGGVLGQVFCRLAAGNPA